MRINLEQTPAPTRDARVASRARAYACWSSDTARAVEASRLLTCTAVCLRDFDGELALGVCGGEGLECLAGAVELVGVLDRDLQGSGLE